MNACRIESNVDRDITIALSCEVVKREFWVFFDLNDLI